VSWIEVDSVTTSAAETDIPFGPIGTKTSFQGRVRAQLDNLPSQHDHYTLIPTYCNQAIEEIQTLGLSMGREMLDQLPRLRNWRWWDVTIAGQNWLPLPERMLWLEGMFYAESTATYDPSTVVLKPSSEPQGANDDFGLYSRTSTGWPTLYRRAGSRVEFWPTPSTSPTDYRATVVLQGTRMDNILSADTDTLLMSPRLQLLAIDLSVAVSMEKMGWDEASEKRTQVETKLGRLISPGEKERSRRKVQTRVAGSP